MLRYNWIENHARVVPAGNVFATTYHVKDLGMKKTHVHIGTSGWHYKHWYGNFYPEKIKDDEQLGYYRKLFNTVEINTIASFASMNLPGIILRKR